MLFAVVVVVLLLMPGLLQEVPPEAKQAIGKRYTCHGDANVRSK